MTERGATAYPFRDWSDVERVAKDHFDVRTFRPGQRALIEAVLSGRDAIGILPTGGGKSLAFQLPSLFLDRAVVVVSPLLALIRDQNEKLEGFDVPAARIDSTLLAHEARDALERTAGGRLDILYVTPEGLRRAEVRDALAARGVALFVVDEAHCVSSWGHDFRPAYLGLADAFDVLGRPPVLALTATATESVARDVSAQLRLREPLVVRTSCERPNVELTVARTPSAERKREVLDAILATEAGSGIIYTTTVKRAEELWTELSSKLEDGVGRYHGELPKNVRMTTQDAFMDGSCRLIVATKAFGMGIDKPDVRFIVHDTFPESLEAYLQEAGRAGRDGKPARATLFYRLEDKRVHDYFLRGKYASATDVARLVTALCERAEGDVFEAGPVSEALRMGQRKVTALLHALARLGAVTPHGASFEVTDRARCRTSTAVLVEEGAALRAADRARVRAMMRYAERVTCRWEQVRAHFGETAADACARCDVCVATDEGTTTATSTEGQVAARRGSRVRSPRKR